MIQKLKGKVRMLASLMVRINIMDLVDFRNVDLSMKECGKMVRKMAGAA